MMPQFRNPSLDWLVDIPLKFLSTMLGLGAGLSLRKCGPGGKGFSRYFPDPIRRGRSHHLRGSSERMHLSPLFLVCAMSAATAADLTAAYYLKSSPLFDFTHINPLTIQLIPGLSIPLSVPQFI